MSHYDERPKDRIVTDEHPGYDARAHWCGEDRLYATFDGSADEGYEPRPLYSERVASTPNLRRVRAWAAWAGATWRIVKWLAVFAFGFALGVYAESAVWR